VTISIEDFIENCKDVATAPKVIFEIGAHHALDAVKMKRAFPLSDVYAFEAHPGCYKAGKDYAHGEDIEYYNIGMWNKEVEILFYDKEPDGHAGISSFRDRGEQYGNATFKLKATTVEKFCLTNEVDFIDIVKLDVEGCSYEVLCGFGDILRTVKIIHLETEKEQHFSGQHTEEEVFELLSERGFKKTGYSWCCLSQYDSVWVRGE